MAIRYNTKSQKEETNEELNEQSSLMSGLEDNDGKDLDDNEEENVDIPQNSEEESLAPNAKTSSAPIIVPEEEIKLESSVIKLPKSEEKEKVENKISTTNPIDEIKEVKIASKKTDSS